MTDLNCTINHGNNPCNCFKAYTPVPYERKCGGETGFTHWQGCDCHEKAWENKVDRLKAENERLRADLDEAINTLGKIAAYQEGPIVTGKFDEPASAQAAREFLSRINKGEK